MAFWSRWLSRKESAAGPIIARRQAGKAIAPLERYDQFAKEGYQANVVAYRAVKDIAQAAAYVPLLLFSGDEELEQDHEVLQLMRRANPLQGWVAWTVNVLSDFQITGNAYMEAVGPVVGPPTERYVLRPDRMKVVPGESGLPRAYVYAIGNDKVTYEVDGLTGESDVRHLKTYNPLDDWYGMSPIQAASHGVNQFNQAGEWNQNLLKNGASRGGVLELQAQDGHFDILTDPDYDKITKRLDEQFAGPENAGRWKLAEGGLKYVPTMFSPQDMDWIDGKHTSARDICGAFGYPCQLMGIPGDNTYSNYKEARQALYENTVMPILGMLLSELNVWLMPRYGEGLTLRPNEDAVLGLAPRRESLWDRISAADFLSIDEKREALGYGPHVPDGNPAHDLYQPATQLPLGFTAETDEPGGGE
jgi:HK97 family phage portal protein